MKRFACASLLLASVLGCAHAAERPNVPVFRSGPWFVVRSVRDGGSTVACTGFYRANRHVQLSADMLIIQTEAPVQSVAFAFDGEPMPAQRPVTQAEKELHAIAFTGADFDKLTRSKKVRVQAATARGVSKHDLELNGLAAALENIRAGCPAEGRPVRSAPRS